VNALNVNLQNNEGQTPLHLAVIAKSDFYTGELKSLKVDASLKDNSEKKAIDYAEKNTSIQIGLEAYMM
jgi:ankyrin repeat protein